MVLLKPFRCQQCHALDKSRTFRAVAGLMSGKNGIFITIRPSAIPLILVSSVLMEFKSRNHPSLCLFFSNKNHTISIVKNRITRAVKCQGM